LAAKRQDGEIMNVTYKILCAVLLAAPVAVSVQPAQAQVAGAVADKPGVALGKAIDAAVRKVIAANPGVGEPALQAAVEAALEAEFTRAKPTAAIGGEALDHAQAALTLSRLFTPPVERAFKTARKALEALENPAAGPNDSSFLGAPPAVSGGGGTSTGTYGNL
jgi:hypothetical protein